MSRFKIEDFSPSVQAQIRAQLADYSRPPDEIHMPDDPDIGPPTGARAKNTRRTPNKTEAHYRLIHFRGLDARYEALTFRMSNGHRYTPDWVVFEEGRPVACHECKGSYKLHSQQRARLAFDQCAKEFPGLNWFWAVKDKTAPGGWRQHHA